MRITRLPFAIAFISVAACGPSEPSMDAALRGDLSMAAQPYMPQQYMSPLEAGYAGYGTPNAYYPQGNYGYGAPGPVYAPASVQRAGTIRRAPSSGGSGQRGGVTIRKNTKRDAVIGAVAGAAIGAVTSSKKDRAKGAVIGAAAGAILGGIIGNNVDLTKVRIPQ